MKKTYIIPHVNSTEVINEKPIVTSGVSSSNGITYGGVDGDGELDPSVKQNTFFDFDWE